MLKLLKMEFISCGPWRWFVLCICLVCLAAAAPARCLEVTGHLESLGIALSKRYPEGEMIYARNVWDLQAFAGRIYIGGGNWDNKGPAPNAGPVPILAWDPDRGRFVREGEVDEEEISRFEVIDGTLYIPGADPRQSWDLGNMYRREANGDWRKLRTIPRAIHTYALRKHNGRFYAGLKATDTVPWYVDFKGYGSAVAVSDDEGASWEFRPLGGYAVLEFLQVGGCLYAMDLTLGPGLRKWIAEQDREAYYAPAYELDSSERGFLRRPDLDASHLFPGTVEGQDRACGVFRAVSLDGSALYISSGGARHGLYRADSLRKGNIRTARIALPEGTRPRDLLVRDGAAFVLLEGQAGTIGVEVSVLASRDLKKWVQLLHFKAPTFARSFEIGNGDFYFGLGCDITKRTDWGQAELHPKTGSLLRLKGTFLPQLDNFLP